MTEDQKNPEETERVHKGEFIELNTFIKLKGLAASGGQAKFLIRSGVISVNGAPETRNKKKLQENDVVEYDGKKYQVKL